ncbi:RNA polymerase sigma factor [Pedobacter sp. GR22-6]|uniref:RNA polymerase sigma factor n=1 Tax=Pedobacter sp. GR22-6 TaxID=3127957 RepID=UPI00307CD7D4
MDTRKPNITAESELWNRFRAGDRTAYTQITTAYINPLFNYGYRICPDRDFVKDCVQEVFIELWNRRSTINETQSVKWYLFKAVRLRIFRELPKWGRNESLNDDYQFTVEFNIESRLIADLEVQELSSKVKAVLNGLPSRQREIMYLRFYEELDFEQISEIMQISRQSVHNLLQKAYHNFRGEWNTLLLLLLMGEAKF